MNVNTEADELHPWLTADGKSLYFSRKTPDGWRVFLTTRTASTGPGGWQEPEQVDLPLHFHHATLTPDGKAMYLQGPLEKDRWGLFLSTKSGKAWSKPEDLAGLNHPDGKTGDRSPNLTRDGKLLYFASDRPGGKGGLDLWGIPTAMLKKK
jgi:Tol biopolymer transport system component